MPANFSPHQIYVYSKYLPNLWLVARIHGCWAVLLCVDFKFGCGFLHIFWGSQWANRCPLFPNWVEVGRCPKNGHAEVTYAQQQNEGGVCTINKRSKRISPLWVFFHKRKSLFGQEIKKIYIPPNMVKWGRKKNKILYHDWIISYVYDIHYSWNSWFYVHKVLKNPQKSANNSWEITIDQKTKSTRWSQDPVDMKC